MGKLKSTATLIYLATVIAYCFSAPHYLADRYFVQWNFIWYLGLELLILVFVFDELKKTKKEALKWLYAGVVIYQFMMLILNIKAIVTHNILRPFSNSIGLIVAGSLLFCFFMYLLIRDRWAKFGK